MARWFCGILVGLWSLGLNAQTAPATHIVYKCVYPSGYVQFTNRTCPEGTTAIPVSAYAEPKPKASEPDESDLTSHSHYTNHAGETVHSPSATASGEVPAGASAQCVDGTYSFSHSRRGTCSHHGGVARWF